MSHNALAPKEAMNGASCIADRNECQEKRDDLKLDVNFGRAKTCSTITPKREIVEEMPRIYASSAVYIPPASHDKLLLGPFPETDLRRSVFTPPGSAALTAFLVWFLSGADRIAARVANLLCRGQEKRTMRKRLGLNRRFRLIFHNFGLAISSRHRDKNFLTRGLAYVFDT